MSRLVWLIASSLTLCLVSCKKDDPESLEGTWVKQRGTVTTFNERNQFVSTQEVPGTYSVIITGQTFQYLRSDGALDGDPHAYSRQGDKIRFARTSQYLTLTELTEHTLTMHSDGEYVYPSVTMNGSRQSTDVYYTR